MINPIESLENELVEVHNFIKSHGIDLSKLLKNLTKNKANPKISFTEFETFFSYLKIPFFTEETTSKLFNFFDTNKENYVEFEVFHDIMLFLKKSRFYELLVKNSQRTTVHKSNFNRFERNLQRSVSPAERKTRDFRQEKEKNNGFSTQKKTANRFDQKSYHSFQKGWFLLIFMDFY